MSGWPLLVGALFFYVCSAFLAMSETGLTTMSRVKAITLEEEGRRGARRLVRIAEEKERYLNPVLLLVLACQISGSTLVGAFISKLFGGVAAVVATVLQIILVFVLCESMPKTWAVQHPERASLRAAPVVSAIVAFPPVRFLTRMLIGLSNVILPGKGRAQGPTMSEVELRASADVAVEEGSIETDERALIHSIFEFGDTVAREVMVPRPDMTAVSGRDRVEDVLEVAITSGHSRIPVSEQSIDDITGVVLIKDLIRVEREGRGDEPVREIQRPAHFVFEGKKAAELMREMQREQYHMAIVHDEYGGTAGIVTLEDLIEELVGEITDEYDVEEPEVVHSAGGEVSVNARTPIDELNELLGADLPEGDYDSVGGLFLSLLGHLPVEGEEVVSDGHRLKAEEVQGQRINRVRIIPLPPDERPEAPMEV